VNTPSLFYLKTISYIIGIKNDKYQAANNLLAYLKNIPQQEINNLRCKTCHKLL